MHPCFAAALDAAKGHFWLAEPIEGDPKEPRSATQRRRILRCGQLLGLSAATPPRAAERIAQQLGIMGLEHRRCRERFGSSRSLRRRGEAIATVLRAMECDSPLCSRMLAAGFLAGLWGPPGIWVVELGRCVSPLSLVGQSLRGPP